MPQNSPCSFANSASPAAWLVLGLIVSACSRAPVPSRLSDRPLVIAPGASQLVLAGGANYGQSPFFGRTPIRPVPSDGGIAAAGGFRAGVTEGIDLRLPFLLGIALVERDTFELAMEVGIDEFGFGISHAVDYGFIRPSAGLSSKLRLADDAALFVGASAGFRVIFASRAEDHGPLFISLHHTVVHDVSEYVSIALSAGLTGIVDPGYDHELFLRVGGFGAQTGSPIPMLAIHLSPSWDIIGGVGATIALAPEEKSGVYAVAGFEWHSSVE